MKMFFYILGHNGDIHHSREYIRDIINKTNYDEYYYLSENPRNASNLLKDIDKLSFDAIDNNCYDGISTNPKYIYGHYVLRIDSDIYIKIPMNIDLKAVHFIFKQIYDELQINIEQLNFYEPKINYNVHNLTNVNEYIDKSINRFKVIISNGPIRSFQAGEVDFVRLIDNLSEDFPGVDFILTEKINIEKPNVLFTSDIIKSNSCDLMEISYLSTFCNIIIGRSSSPYCQMLVKDNLRDVNKTIIFTVFSLNAGIYFYDTPINKIWIKNLDFNNVYNVIKNEIHRKTVIDSILSIRKESDNRIYIRSLIPDDSIKEIRFYKYYLYENMDIDSQNMNEYCWHHINMTTGDMWVVPYGGYNYKDRIKIRINYKNSVYLKII